MESHSTEGRAETVGKAVQEIRAPDGNAKAGSGAWMEVWRLYGGSVLLTKL